MVGIEVGIDTDLDGGFEGCDEEEEGGGGGGGGRRTGGVGSEAIGA